jgi:Type ISP C-terminal specificity domain/N-6 DNA Methylase
MDINGYLNEIRALSASGQATEHSYRPALERLFKSIDDDLTVINEPKRLTDVGAPDFVFNRNGVSVGWCEAKDLIKDIRKFASGDYSKEQKARYAKGLPNLIYTNGTDFEFIVKGEVTGFVSIADLIPTLPSRPEEFPRLEMLLKDFASQTPISINTAKQLAQMMAGKAVIIKDIMGQALDADKKAGIATELTDQYEGFKSSLIHDITIADFADVYAETIAYGLFAARLHDTSMDTFNRAEALELLPKSNPFLKNLFVYIAGPNLDERLRRMIDDLCDVFRACDVGALMQDFGKFTARNDPFLHFYETFLAEYNPAKRKARGVWYTPEPVVNFIVRAVDDVLKTEFGLPMGLADTSKISIDWDSGQNDAKGKPVMVKKDVHRVQILDPATGTGTFLAEAIKQIAAQVKDVAPAMWSSYVERDLIPRLHGFELLMASYAMCHMKLDMMLTDMGYKPSATPPRLGVYLTNSLEEGERVEQTLPFARWLSEEAKGANTIKRDTPIMCVIGNPPYSGESANKGEWIMGLMEAYKKEPGGKVKLNERNPKWINDDYVKFIRFAEHMIAKNGEGILGFITNHGYLDNPTFRGMRWHLLDTFDKVFVLDLHGNAKKKEVSPDGTADKNVFDIQQGVSILIGVKKSDTTSVSKRAAEVFHCDLWGTRDAKNDALWEGSVGNLQWTKLHPSLPHLCLIERDETQEGVYNQGFPIGDFMPVNSVGIVTGRDDLAIDMDKDTLWDRIRDISETDSQILMEKYQFGRNAKLGDVSTIKKEIVGNLSDKNLVKLNYRPFDIRYTYYIKSNGFITRSRFNVMRHMFGHDNLSILISRSAAGQATWQEVQCSSTICEFGIMSTRPGNGTPLFPLYLYPEEGTLETERRVNFDPKIYAEIRERAGLSRPLPVGEGGAAIAAGGEGEQPDEAPSPSHAARGPLPLPQGEEIPDELRVFDYIYGVLHSPDYRATYAQFLKIDFPRIPYPASPEIFAHVADKGGQLRRLHLMEAEAIGAAPYPFMGEGDGVVVKPAFAPTPNPSRKREGSETCQAEGEVSRSRVGNVHINPDQYFENVPAVAWEFHIGGYQPAQKWLKDRKGRALSFDDCVHYQRIIKILC